MRVTTRPAEATLGLLLTAAITAIVPFPDAAAAFQAPAAFEVASIKASAPDSQAGRYITTPSPRQMLVRNYSTRDLLVRAFRVTPAAIIGGPRWIETERYDIDAVTPGEARTSRDEQAAMFRQLLVDRFNLVFHLEERQMALYALVVAKDGPKLRPSAAEVKPALAPLVNRVFPDRVVTEGRVAALNELAALLQDGLVDRPVIDRTGITGTYDFNVEWVPDGLSSLRLPAPDSAKPGLFTALQEQLGLRLESTRGSGQALVIDRIERPSEN